MTQSGHPAVARIAELNRAGHAHPWKVISTATHIKIMKSSPTNTPRQFGSMASTQRNGLLNWTMVQLSFDVNQYRGNIVRFMFAVDSLNVPSARTDCECHFDSINLSVARRAPWISSASLR